MKQVFFRQGGLSIEEVPPPAVQPGSLLVSTAYSCVSPGTELAGLKASGKPLWKRALTEPTSVRRALDLIRERGVQQALRTVRASTGVPRPAGYSAAGTVLAIGEGVTGFRAGDPVACAGADHAYHAEVICVPENLCVPVPANLGLAEASTVTLGAIALQGVRRAQPTLGETFAVIGLGALGQLTAQLLKANGCRVVAMDIDAARVRLARSLGADLGLSSNEPAALEAVLRATDGYGADGAIITASSASDSIVSLAFSLCRKKGRVVLVGDVGLAIDRADIYEKELDFLVSTSYGPGRYDRRYEDEGLDYPIGHVRWTENRNMRQYLELAAAGRVRLEPLFGGRFPVGDAASAFAALSSSAALMALLEYPASSLPLPGVVSNPGARPTRQGAVRLALIGAGSFVRNAYFPALQALGDRYAVRAVVGRTGHTAQEAARGCGAAYATTDLAQVLDDQDVDAVVIGTRHDQHAALALQALRAGKHVLVEKPLTLSAAELAEIEAFFASAGSSAPVLLTGFNRRFSPTARALRERLASAANPALLVYRVNAGHLPQDHWVHGPEGGGRNLGEACHFYDLFTFLSGARVRDVAAVPVHPRTAYYRADDNFSALVSFDDGTVASLAYTAMGWPGEAKERLDAYCDGDILRLEDFHSLGSAREGKTIISSAQPEKGLREQLKAFHAAVRGESGWPAELWEQVQATRIALEVQTHLAGAGG